MERTTGYPWILFRTLHQGLLFFFFSLFVCFWLHHTAWGNLSSPTSDQTCALYIGSMESWLLHHQGSPKVCLFFFFSFFCSWSQTWAMTMIVIILSPDSGGGPCWGCLNQWKIWSGILSASYGLLTHFIWAPEKKIELILIIILAAPLGSMIKFKIYFSWFQEN